MGDKIELYYFNYRTSNYYMIGPKNKQSDLITISEIADFLEKHSYKQQVELIAYRMLSPDKKIHLNYIEIRLYLVAKKWIIGKNGERYFDV